MQELSIGSLPLRVNLFRCLGRLVAADTLPDGADPAEAGWPAVLAEAQRATSARQHGLRHFTWKSTSVKKKIL